MSSLSAIMTDRAAVMKALGRQLETERRVPLQSEEGLDFLHCNALFLLGVSNKVKVKLNLIENGRQHLPGSDGHQNALRTGN